MSIPPTGSLSSMPWPTINAGNNSGAGPLMRPLCAAIVYVLVSGCAWRQLPPCFGISKSTAHRRFLIWSRAGVWGRLHEAVLHRLDDAGLFDVTRVVLDTAHVRAKKGGEHTGPSPVDRGKPGTKMHVLSDANGLPLLVGISASNTHA